MFAKLILSASLFLAFPPVHAATFSGRTEGKDTVVIDGKGSDKDEQCTAAMSFKYRDLKSDPAKPKEDGRQFCPPKLIPAGTSVELCRMKYVGITDVEAKPPPTADCRPPGSPDSKKPTKLP